MSSTLDWCPAWVAYGGAIGMWCLLIGAGIWAIILGYNEYEEQNKFENEATSEECFIFDYDTHICSCGLQCSFWSHEYYAISDKCENKTLTTGEYGGMPCDYQHYEPLEINKTYNCFVLQCKNAQFSFQRSFSTNYQPTEMIIGGIVLLTCFGCFPFLCLVTYFGYKLSKNTNYHRIQQ